MEIKPGWPATGGAGAGAMTLTAPPKAGQNAHRLSIEWSRIQPEPDRWNEDALDVYREMLRGLTDRGMTPLVTLHHFTDPLWLFERGGWENDETPALFDEICAPGGGCAAANTARPGSRSTSPMCTSTAATWAAASRRARTTWARPSR